MKFLRRRPVVIIFARVPRLGAVKRRLAAGVGMHEAYQFYVRSFSKLVRSLSSHPHWDLELCVTPRNVRGVNRILCHSETITFQSFGDLGLRMERAISKHNYSPVLLVGSDIPGILPSDIENGIRALGRNDFVFGPTLDGGYWLTGARRGNLVRGIYKHVRWSSTYALSDTMRNTQGRKVSTLRHLRDIDHKEDYYEYMKSG